MTERPVGRIFPVLNATGYGGRHSRKPEKRWHLDELPAAEEEFRCSTSLLKDLLI